MNEEEKRSSSFFNGLTLGAILGACFFFLFGTKKGRKVKGKLVKKGKNFWQELEGVIDEIKKDPDFLTKKTKELTDEIEEKASKAKKQVQKKVKKTKKQIEQQTSKAKQATVKIVKEKAAKALEQAEKIQKATLNKTKQARHFFQKNGRSLGK